MTVWLQINIKQEIQEENSWIQQENLYQIRFPATTKTTDTTAQLYCTLSMYVPKTIPRQNKKKLHNTTTVWFSKDISSM